MSRSQLRGAGPAGGLLFLGVLGFLGWLVATETVGVLRILLLAVVVAAVVALAVDIGRRR